MNAPRDAAVRERVLNTRQSFCVSAPAGSGKTELLTQRVLALLAEVEQPEQILAITFTRKAAAEMQHRILDALRRAATEPEPQTPHQHRSWQLARAALINDQRQGWNLLSHPARLRVMTIDGFCATLARQAPLSSGFGATPGVAEDASERYREAAQRVIAHLGGAELPDLGVVYRHLDNDASRLQRLLVSLLARRDQWLPLTALLHDASAARRALETLACCVIEDALVQAARALSPYAGDLLPLLDFAATQLRQRQPDHALAALAGCVALPSTDCSGQAHWRAIADWLLTKGDTGKWRSRFDVKSGFPPATDKQVPDAAARKAAMDNLMNALQASSDIVDALHNLRSLPAPNYAPSQWRVLQALLQVLRLAAAELQLVFAQHGEVDFSEIAMAAQRALGTAEQPGDVLLRLDYRLQHILIDEFQDTSVTQFRLLESLLEGWAEHNAESPERPRTLFVVGDGMQSIYGFREAEVGLFIRAREQGIRGLPLEDARLDTNFRSHPAVVDWVNAQFSQAFPQVAHIGRGAVPYDHCVAFKPAIAGSGVNIDGFIDDDDGVAQAGAVRMAVQEALRETDDGRIAVLVRSRAHLRPIVAALAEAGIAWRAVDIEPLAQRAVVQDLLSLLQVLLSPEDRIAWLALLRSPMLGLTHAELTLLLGQTDAEGHWLHPWLCLRDPLSQRKLAAGSRDLVQRLVRVLGLAWDERGRLGLRDWLHAIWVALGGVWDSDAQALLQLIAELEQRGEFSLALLKQRVDKLFAAEQADPTARVELLTIHKSKGLQYDTVILPSLDRGGRNDERELLLWGEYLATDGRAGLLLSAPASWASRDEDPTYAYLKREAKLKRQLEERRLFYVAVTRAIRRVHLLFGTTRDAQGEPKPPSTGSLLDALWGGIETSVRWHQSVGDEQPAQTSLLFEEVSVAEPPLLQLAASWQAPERIGTSLRRVHSFGNDENRPEPDLEAQASAMGQTVHWLLQHLAEQGEASWLARTPAQRASLVHTLMAQYGAQYGAAETQQLVPQVLAQIDATLADAQGRWLLLTPHAEARNEWPLLLRQQQEWRTQILDRSFVDADERRWIIDYKTAAPAQSETEDAFIARQIQMHQAQLRAYRQALQQLEQRELITALYFPALPKLVEVPT